MKTLIVYRSFLGSSKQYAAWLHEVLPSDLMKFNHGGGKKLAAYDTVVIFGGTYGGWLSMAGYLKSKWKRLQGRRVVFVTVAGDPAETGSSVKAYSKVPENIRVAVKHFHLPGKFNQINIGAVKKENIAPIVDYLKSA